jgi:hypothetical protein
MRLSIGQFMEAYRSAWERQAIDEFLKMYDRPMMTLRRDGSLTCLHDDAELRALYGPALDAYIATGYETAGLTIDRETAMGATAVIVDVTWTLKRAPDVVVQNFRQSYAVRQTTDGWKISFSAMHAE